MADFQPFNLGSVLQQAEVLRGMKRQATLDDLQAKYLGGQITRAESADSRAASQESRAATEFSQEQQITNTRLLNMAAAEVAENPAAASRWDPIIKSAIPDWQPVQGDPEQIRSAAKQLFESTSQALQAYQRTGTAANVQSTFVGQNGNVWQTLRDGQTRDTGVAARPQNLQTTKVSLPDGRTIDAQIDPTSGAVYGMGGELLSAPVRDAGSGATAQPAQTTPGMGTSQSPADAASDKAFAEAEAQDLLNSPKRLAAANDTIAQIEGNLLPVFESVGKNADAWTVGLLSSVAPRGSPAADLKSNLGTLLANTAFDRLQEMRNNSPTGGALGAVTERELDLLAATRSALEQSQSPEQFKTNLARLRQHYERVLTVAKQSRQVDQLKAQLVQLRRRPANEGTQGRMARIQERIAQTEDAWWDSLEDGAQPPTQTAGQPSQIQTEEQYNALPSGSQYVAPDGSVRTKL